VKKQHREDKLKPGSWREKGRHEDEVVRMRRGDTKKKVFVYF
jgi:hypothetical protein